MGRPARFIVRQVGLLRQHGWRSRTKVLVKKMLTWLLPIKARLRERFPRLHRAILHLLNFAGIGQRLALWYRHHTKPNWNASASPDAVPLSEQISSSAQQETDVMSIEKATEKATPVLGPRAQEIYGALRTRLEQREQP